LDLELYLDIVLARGFAPDLQLPPERRFGSIMTSGIFLSTSLNRALSKPTVSTTADGTSPLEARTAILGIIKQSRREFLEVLQGFDGDLEVLEVALNDTQDVIAILEEAGGLTIRARNMGQHQDGFEQFKEQIQDAENGFLKTLMKLDQRIDLSTNSVPVNLLKGEALVIKFDPAGRSTLTTQGISLTAESLGFRRPDFSSLHSIQNSRIDVANAIDLAVTLRHMISSDISTIKTRREFCEVALSFLSQAQDSLGKPTSFSETESIPDLLSAKIFADDETMAAEGQMHLLHKLKTQ
jgi:hypothetical protein